MRLVRVGMRCVAAQPNNPENQKEVCDPEQSYEDRYVLPGSYPGHFVFRSFGAECMSCGGDNHIGNLDTFHARNARLVPVRTPAIQPVTVSLRYTHLVIQKSHI